jgi:hypothetical protein
MLYATPPMGLSGMANDIQELQRCLVASLRHYYASITLADAVNIKEVAEYLRHGDPGFTLRLYTHMLPSSHERARKAVDSRSAGSIRAGVRLRGMLRRIAHYGALEVADVLERTRG